jgi:uncharacterized membrane protein YesL
MNDLKASGEVILDALSQWWYSWLILMLLNTLLVLCWITVILGPPASFGFYYAIHSLIESHSTNWREFLEGAKRYFFKAWLWALLNLAVFFLVRISLEYYSQFIEGSIFFNLSLVIALLWLCLQFYTIPYMLEQEQKNVLLAFRNSLLTMLASPLFTLVLLIFLFFILWLSMSFPILLIIGSPALIAVLGVKALKERLSHFKKDDAAKTTA